MASEQKKMSAKQRFISIIEQKILSGELEVDQKLPPERELAEQTGISRVTVHAALLELATKNVLRIIPRQGTYVNNFKRDGTLELYGALMQYTGDFDRDILRSMTDFREIIETAAAKKAAHNRRADDIAQMNKLLQKERTAQSAREAAELDYQLHVLIARMSGNFVLPMAFHSLEPMYLSLATRFYDMLDDWSVVHDFHAQLIAAIEQGDGAAAKAVMKSMLDHGKNVLLQQKGRLK